MGGSAAGERCHRVAEMVVRMMTIRASDDVLGGTQHPRDVVNTHSELQQHRGTGEFLGSYTKLQGCVSRTRLDGKWRELEYGQKQFRTDDGGYLNWWEGTGSITFQGHNLAAREGLTQAFIAVASAKRRLLGEYRGRVFHGRFGSLYAE
jgi:hypothetical protein